MTTTAPTLVTQEDEIKRRKNFNIDKEEQECFLTPVLLGDGRCIVLQDQFVYQGRLAIPDTAKRLPTTGYVVRVSDLDKYGDLVGKRVVFGVYSGTGMYFKGQMKYRSLDLREILAVVERTDVELEEIG
jgi:co-chaperonin GroES (HSP10)